MEDLEKKLALLDAELILTHESNKKEVVEMLDFIRVNPKKEVTVNNRMCLMLIYWGIEYGEELDLPLTSDYQIINDLEGEDGS